MLQPEPSNMQHTLPSFSCMLQACVCIASRVCYVTARAFQYATYTTQLSSMLCCSHSLPECNAYFQILLSYSEHPHRHTHIVPANCYHFGALLRVMCIILLNCSSRAAAVFVAHITQLRAMLRAACSCCACLSNTMYFARALPTLL